MNEINSTSFESEVIQSPIPVLVDFFAPWCGPCKFLLPVLEKTADELAGKVKFVKVDVDSSSDLAASFGVRSVPTLVLFQGGQPIGTRVGTISPRDLKDWFRDSGV